MKKVNGSRTVVYVYGVDRNLIQEYDTATPVETGRQYLAQDMLGSTRVVFNSAGTAVRCMDYLPFGEQIPQGVGSGRSGACWASSEEPRQKYTGKEREGAESAYLDFFEARYFSGAQGRFTTPDWAENPEAVPYADFDDPQSLNLYGYVRNNPINNRDLDGHVCFFGFGSTCAKPPEPPPSRQSQMTSGVFKTTLGVALIATALGGNIPGGAVGTLLVGGAVYSGTVTTVSGVTDMDAAAKRKDVTQAQKELDAIGNFAGLATTAATGDLEAGKAAATVMDVATLAARPREIYSNPATFLESLRVAGNASELAIQLWDRIMGGRSGLATARPIPLPGSSSGRRNR